MRIVEASVGENQTHIVNESCRRIAGWIGGWVGVYGGVWGWMGVGGCGWGWMGWVAVERAVNRIVAQWRRETSGILVGSLRKLGINGTEVHGLLDDVIVVGQIEGFRVDRYREEMRILLFHQWGEQLRGGMRG